MTRITTRQLRLGLGAAAFGLTAAVNAAQVELTITVVNLAPANSVSFAPLHFGVHGGGFDAFDLGRPATAPIISVAEGGAGGAWQAAFAAADPTAVRGTIGGLLQPGQTRTSTITVDTASNPYFTFAAMVVPSNDFFIGNDSPLAHRLFDAAGQLVIGSIGQTAGQIWDAGSEAFDPAAAAFVGNNDLRTPQGSVVAFNFAELAGFDGLTTGAGYVFDSALTAGSEIYRISFASNPIPVPEPAVSGLLLAGLLAIGFVVGWRRADGVQPATGSA